MRYLLLLLFLIPFLASCATPRPAPGAFESAEQRIEAAAEPQLFRGCHRSVLLGKTQRMPHAASGVARSRRRSTSLARA